MSDFESIEAVVRWVSHGGDNGDRFADGVDALLSFYLEMNQLRTCDGCGKVEDAGTAPDQDGEGRSECCWPTSRRNRLRTILKQYEDEANTTLEDLLLEVEEPESSIEVHRFLLLEESRINGEVAASLHKDVPSALEYQGEQECAEDWEPKLLIDLDSNEIHTLRRRYVAEVAR